MEQFSYKSDTVFCSKELIGHASNITLLRRGFNLISLDHEAMEGEGGFGHEYNFVQNWCILIATSYLETTPIMYC